MTELTSALQQRSSTTMMMMRKTTRDVLDVDNNVNNSVNVNNNVNVNNVNQQESTQHNNNKTTSSRYRNRNRTNNRWTRKSGWKTKVVLLLIPLLVVLLLLLILIVIVIDHYYQQQPIKQQQQHPLLQKPKHQYQYQHVPPPHLFPQICSHQLLNPPPLSSSSSSSSSPSIKKTINDGSLDAMTALWYEGGITCFDIDVVVLSDGTMLATHPKRMTAAISKALEQRQQQQNNNNDDKEEEEEEEGKDVIKIEEYTVDLIYDLLLLSSSGGEEEEKKKKKNSPFPIFDTELLPHYAALVHTTTTTTSNTSSPRGQQQVHHHQQQEEEIIVPWMLRGPLLNIDLKLGPYLTENRVLELLQSITDLGLEDYIAICVSPPEAYEYPSSSSSSSSSLNLWKILHSYNNDKKMEMEMEKQKKKIIALGLVLRDLVPDEKNVNRIQQLVSQDYDLYKSDSDADSGADVDADSGGSIKLLIPSFKFEKEWYNTIRGEEVASRSSENKNDSTGAILLRRLPMTVWTIDTIQDYQYVTSMTTTNGIVMASAVVANNPMQIIEQAITAESITARRRGQN